MFSDTFHLMIFVFRLLITFRNNFRFKRYNNDNLFRQYGCTKFQQLRFLIFIYINLNEFSISNKIDFFQNNYILKLILLVNFNIDRY